VDDQPEIKARLGPTHIKPTQPQLLRQENPTVIPFRIGLRRQKGFLVAEQDAGEISNAGTDRQNLGAISLAPLLNKEGNLGPRPNQTHLSCQNVKQLRQFIELGATQPTAKPCDTGVAPDSQ